MRLGAWGGQVGVEAADGSGEGVSRDEAVLKTFGEEVDPAGSLGGNEVDGGQSLLLLNLLGLFLLEDPLVVERKNLDEEGEDVVEVSKDAVCDLRASKVPVVLQHLSHLGDLSGVLDSSKLDHLHVDLGGEGVGDIENVGDSSAHAGREVSSCRAEDKDPTSLQKRASSGHAAGDRERKKPTHGHVLASVVPCSLNDGVCPRVSNGESFGGDTAEVGVSARGSVEGDVADDDVLLCLERRLLGRVDDESTTAKGGQRVSAGT